MLLTSQKVSISDVMAVLQYRHSVHSLQINYKLGDMLTERAFVGYCILIKMHIAR